MKSKEKINCKILVHFFFCEMTPVLQREEGSVLQREVGLISVSDNLLSVN